MRTSEGQDYIQELTQALRELQLAQGRVNEVIKRIRARENSTRNNQNQVVEQQQTQDEGAQLNQRIGGLPIARIVEENENIPGTTLKIGDRVRILNPNRNQENSGIITGYRETHVYTWIIVTSRSGKEIKRIAKNLRRL